MRVLDGGPLTAGGGARDHGFDQPGRLGLAAADRRERDRRVWTDAGPGRLLDGVRLRRQQLGALEVAAERGRLAVHVVR